MREILTDITSIGDIILMFNSVEQFSANIKVNVSVTNIEQMQMITKGQSDINTALLEFRKETVTASKSHEITTNMKKKTVKGGGGFVNIWNLCQKICGLTRINPNILVLKDGSDIEQHVSNAFFETFKCNHKKPKSCNCWLFLGGKRSFNGLSSHGIVECASGGQVWVEIKCPSLMSPTGPPEPDVKLPFLKMINNEQKLNQNHKYYTLCQQQMTITGIEKFYFLFISHMGFIWKKF